MALFLVYQYVRRQYYHRVYLASQGVPQVAFSSCQMLPDGSFSPWIVSPWHGSFRGYLSVMFVWAHYRGDNNRLRSHTWNIDRMAWLFQQPDWLCHMLDIDHCPAAYAIVPYCPDALGAYLQPRDDDEWTMLTSSR